MSAHHDHDFRPSARHGQFDATRDHERRHDVACPCIVGCAACRTVAENGPFSRCERCGWLADRFGCLDLERHGYTEDEKLDLLLSGMFK